MFFTRLGFNSKIVIIGDITQIDLPQDRKSGLVEATRVLQGVPDIGITRFADKDVVRACEAYYAENRKDQKTWTK